MWGRGVTLIEVLVAAFIGSILFGVVTLVISRTNVTFTKTTDMIKAQVLLETIVQHLRSDTRCMTSKVVALSDGISFATRRGGREQMISYRFEESSRSVFREISEAGGVSRRQDFQSRGNIFLARFHPGRMDGAGGSDLVDHINIVLQIQVQEKENMPPSRISLLGQVFSKAVRFPNPYRASE